MLLFPDGLFTHFWCFSDILHALREWKHDVNDLNLILQMIPVINCMEKDFWRGKHIQAFASLKRFCIFVLKFQSFLFLTFTNMTERFALFASFARSFRCQTIHFPHWNCDNFLCNFKDIWESWAGSILISRSRVWFSFHMAAHSSLCQTRNWTFCPWPEMGLPSTDNTLHGQIPLETSGGLPNKNFLG